MTQKSRHGFGQIFVYCIFPLIITFLIVACNAVEPEKSTELNTENLVKSEAVISSTDDINDIDISIFVTDIEPPDINEHYFNTDT